LRPEQDETSGRLLRIEETIRRYESELMKLRMERVGLADDLLTGRVRATPLLKQE
jgi:type I restriction enzyme S subunit